MDAKAFLCNGCMVVVFLDELDDQGKCPYCGSLELEFIEGGAPVVRPDIQKAPPGTYKGDEDIWGQAGYWWSG